MSALSIQVPFPVFQDRDGQPLDNGYVWIGSPNLPPQTNPVTVYFDDALTVPAAQPLRTINGYISNSGTPAQIYVDGVNFSILVQDSKGSMVYNFPEGTGISPDACGVTYDPPFTGAVAYPVCEKLEQTVSVKDFGAVGDGVADDAIAINLAVEYVNSIGGGGVYIPSGTYRITQPIHLDNFNITTHLYNSLIVPSRNINVFGDGPGATVIVPDGFWVSAFTTFPDPYLNTGNVPLKNVLKYKAENIHVRDLTVDMDYDTNPDGGAAYGPNYASWGGTWPNGASGASTWAADNYQYPFYMERVRKFSIRNVEVKQSWYNGVEVYMCEDGIIDGNLFTNVCDKQNYLGYYCVFEPDAGARNITFSNNICREIGNGVVANGDGLSYVDNAVENIEIVGNVFDTIEANGIFAFQWLKNWNVSNNTFSNIQDNGLKFDANGGSPVAGKHPENIIISDNVINEYALSDNSSTGIFFNGVSAQITGNYVKQHFITTTTNLGAVATDDSVTVPGNASYGVVISNNNFNGNFKAATAANGIVACNIANSIISGNTLNRLTATGSHIVLYGNVVKTVGNAFLGTYSGSSPVYVDPAGLPYSNLQVHELGAVFNAFIPSQIVGAGGVFSYLQFTDISDSTYIQNSPGTGTGYIAIGGMPGTYLININVTLNAASAGGCQVLLEQSTGPILTTFLSSSFLSGTISTSALIATNEVIFIRVGAFHSNNFTVEPVNSQIIITKIA
jgi:hypothetical protein